MRNIKDSASHPLWGITCLYNPCGYVSRYRNYDLFRSSTKSQGLPLVAVELAFGRKPFVLKKDSAEILVQLRTGEKNILWQKERLLNLALEKLPASCKKVAWLDCDIVFEDGEWVHKASQLLDQHKVVQLYSLVVNMAEGQNIIDVDVSGLSFGKAAGQKRYGYVYTHLKGMEQLGHAGFAWAARRGVLDKVKFYDRNIIGSGDTLFRDACYGMETIALSRYFSSKALGSQVQWKRKVNETVDNDVSFLPGTIFHSWHGDLALRKYETRNAPLKYFDYDPALDVKAERSKALQWSSDKEALHKAVRDYFYMRDEDGGGF